MPALLCGKPSESVWLCVHGRGGNKEEAADFAETACPLGAQVLAIDLPEHGERRDEHGFFPWKCVPELQTVMSFAREQWEHVSLRAVSIGAWFSLLAFQGAPPERSLFVSPVLDMEHLILDMMLMAGVDRDRLEREGEIRTGLGETLSFEYLQYAAGHQINSWSSPSAILYGARDTLTSRETVTSFAERFGCSLSVMEDGEHWFHTPEQVRFMRDWETRCIKGWLGRD